MHALDFPMNATGAWISNKRFAIDTQRSQMNSQPKRLPGEAGEQQNSADVSFRCTNSEQTPMANCRAIIKIGHRCKRVEGALAACLHSQQVLVYPSLERRFYRPSTVYLISFKWVETEDAKMAEIVSSEEPWIWGHSDSPPIHMHVTGDNFTARRYHEQPNRNLVMTIFQPRELAKGHALLSTEPHSMTSKGHTTRFNSVNNMTFSSPQWQLKFDLIIP